VEVVSNGPLSDWNRNSLSDALRISVDSAKFLTNERKEIECVSRELSGMSVRTVDRSSES